MDNGPTVPTAINDAFEAFRTAYYAYVQRPWGEQVQPAIAAEESLKEAIFDALVLQREMGREEGYEEWDDDDPVGIFIKARQEAGIR